MRRRSTVLVSTFLLVGGGAGLFLEAAAQGASPTAPQGPYKPDFEALKKHNAAPDWFRNAKFGIYFHWGVYSVPAFGSEWYPRNMHIKSRGEYKHHLAQYGDPSKFGYHDFVPMFRAEKFDAEAWARLFNKAGARFAGPVAEHHDGFAMWASKLTPWNVKDMGPKRDITGELAKAIRKWGMRFVATFHHARNNQHQIVKGGKQVWTGHYPRVEGWPTVSEDPKLRMLYGNLPRKEFLELWKGKLIEVIDTYRPDILWFDSWFDEIPSSYQTEFLAYYLNRAHQWGKEVVVTVKQRDLPHEIAVEDFEKGRANRLTDFVWLTDDTISRGSWCYTKRLRIKSTDEVLDTLIDIVSKNGILLLNISPKADGTIPEDQRKVLLGIGKWLSKYGEAIYNTRPWLVFGEGPTRLKKGGHFVKMKGGYTPQDVRFTRRGSTIYAAALGWPGEGKQLVLKSFARAKLEGDLKIVKVSLLGSDQAVSWTWHDQGLALTMPSQKVDDMAVVFKIETTGSAALR